MKRLVELNATVLGGQTPEQIRRARVCGLAMRAWEIERGEKYGQKWDRYGNPVGEDPLIPLTNWAVWNEAIPPLVINYGPPPDTPIEQLEKWMVQPGTPWIVLSDDGVPF